MLQTIRILRAVSALAGAVLVVALMVAAVGLADGWVAWALLAAFGFIALVTAARLNKGVRKGTVLEVDLDGGVAETTGSNPVTRALNRKAVLVRDVVDALRRAEDDDRITGLVARIGNGRIGLGQAQELRDAVHDFRRAGKSTVAYAEAFGEIGDASVDYYLAAAFETVYLQPLGGMSLQGRLARTPFLRGALDRLGIHPDLDHREEYKTAKYMITETGFTAPHREALDGVVGDQFDQIVAGIATDRGIEPDEVRRLIDTAPLGPTEALEAGLVDRLGYRDDAYDTAGDRFLYHDRYLKKAGRPQRKGDRIALVYGSGAIKRGSSGFDPIDRGEAMGSDDVARALRAACDDKKVKAIVFRVDSPGGSAVASEVIRREVVRARESGRPVVVSMGNVAGSGGYWISANADRIVAQPGTITGSIGVVSGKLVTSGAWSRVGINFGQLGFGENAGYYSPQDQFTDRERERLQASLDQIYERFISLVAEGRDMDSDQATEVAKGRIWSGAQAKENGLVDELGGLETAVELAKELADIAPDKPTQVKLFPEERVLPIPKPKESGEPVELAVALLADMVQNAAETTSGAQARMPEIRV